MQNIINENIVDIHISESKYDNENNKNSINSDDNNKKLANNLNQNNDKSLPKKFTLSDHTIKYEKRLAKFLTDPSLLSERQVTNLTRWCIYNYDLIDDAELIIDKLREMNPGLWALSTALETGNELLVNKFWPSLKNFAYDDLISCVSDSGNTNLYKLVYEHVDTSNYFRLNTDSFCMYGYLGAITNGNIESQNFITNRYPQVKFTELCETDYFNEYLTALIFNCAKSIESGSNYYDLATEIIAKLPFLLTNMSLTKRQRPASENPLQIIREVLEHFSDFYEYNGRTVNNQFYELFDQLVQNIDINNYFKYCSNRLIINHLIKKLSPSKFFELLNSESIGHFFKLCHKYSRAKIYQHLQKTIIVEKTDFGQLLKMAAQKKNLDLVSYLLKNHPTLDHVYDALLASLEKRNNLSIISFLVTIVHIIYDKIGKNLDIMKLFNAASRSGQLTNVKYVVEQFGIIFDQAVQPVQQNKGIYIDPNCLLKLVFGKSDPDIDLVQYLMANGATDFSPIIKLCANIGLSFEMLKLILGQSPSHLKSKRAQLLVHSHVHDQSSLDALLYQSLVWQGYSKKEQTDILQLLSVASNLDSYNEFLYNMDLVLHNLIYRKNMPAITVFLQQYCAYVHNIDQIIYECCVYGNLEIVKFIYYYPNNKFKIYDEVFDRLIDCAENDETKKLKLLEDYVVDNASQDIETKNSNDQWIGCF